MQELQEISVPLDTTTLEPFLVSNISLNNSKNIVWDVEKRKSTADTYFQVSVNKALVETDTFYHTVSPSYFSPSSPFSFMASLLRSLDHF